MARRRRGKPIHGWLNIDKPLGLTSAACVAAVKRLTEAAKVGHAGTLDPMATGVLPLALGEATKTVSWLTDAVKVYTVTVRWGERRSTDDAEGDIVETSANRPARDRIIAALPAFIGEIEQTPPAFSAIKIAGRRAYDLARAGQPPEMAPRLVHITDLRLLDMPDADHGVFSVTCGKGTYMRSLARDLAASLDTCGHVAALRRTRVGSFTQDRSISLDMLSDFGHSAAARCTLIPITTALDDIPALALSQSEAARLRSGQAVPIMRPADRAQIQAIGDDGIVLVTAAAIPVALTRVDGIQLRPVRVLNL